MLLVIIFLCSRVWTFCIVVCKCCWQALAGTSKLKFCAKCGTSVHVYYINISNANNIQQISLMYYNLCTTFGAFIQLLNFFVQHLANFYTTFFFGYTTFYTTATFCIPLLYYFLFLIYKKSTTKIYHICN